MSAIVSIPAGHGACEGEVIEGELAVPPDPKGLVIFAHGSGSSRHSSRNLSVAGHLQKAGLATLLLDLLTRREEAEERTTRHHRFDIELLVDRLEAATRFTATHPLAAGLPVGYFGASTGAAAAIAAATATNGVRAVVSRGGRPDLAGAALESICAPTLLIVGGADTVVVDLNRDAMRRMRNAHTRFEIIPGATHLFPEPGALERVAGLAADWFTEHLAV